MDVLVAARSSPRQAAREASAALASLAGNAGVAPASPSSPPAVEAVLPALPTASSGGSSAMLSEAEGTARSHGAGAVIVAVPPPALRAGARAAASCEVALFALPKKHCTEQPQAVPWQVVEDGGGALGLGPASTSADGEMLPPEVRHTKSSGPFGGEANLKALLVVRARWSAAVGATASRLGAMPNGLAVHESIGGGVAVDPEEEAADDAVGAEAESTRAVAVLLPLPKHPDSVGTGVAAAAGADAVPCAWALAARWVDAAGKRGPWSAVASARIAAGSGEYGSEAASGAASGGANGSKKPSTSLVRVVGAGTRSAPVPSASDLSPADLQVAIRGTRSALDGLLGHGEASKALRREAQAGAIALPQVVRACISLGDPVQQRAARQLTEAWAADLAAEGVPKPLPLPADTGDAVKALPWLGWATIRS